jgi:C-terminal processing protease CtpA/Prc
MYNWVFSMDGGPMGQQDWHTAAEQQPFWMQAFDGQFRIAELEGATYLQITEIRDGEDQTFANMARAAVTQAEARDEPALIIDLRRCLGGDGTLNDGLVNALAESETLNRDGRLMVLTSRTTHSAAVMLVSALEQRTAARFIGQATADRPNHYGETNIFVTPNSALPIIYASEYYQTSTPDDQRRFRAPDIAISYTFADYAAGTDAVLETALNHTNGN